jgi:hypothetical protein
MNETEFHLSATAHVLRCMIAEGVADAVAAASAPGVGAPVRIILLESGEFPGHIKIIRMGPPRVEYVQSQCRGFAVGIERMSDLMLRRDEAVAEIMATVRRVAADASANTVYVGMPDCAGHFDRFDGRPIMRFELTYRMVPVNIPV